MNCRYHLSLFCNQGLSLSWGCILKKNHSRIQPTYFLMMPGQPISRWVVQSYLNLEDFLHVEAETKNHSTQNKKKRKGKKSSEPSNLHDFVVPCQSSGELNSTSTSSNLDLGTFVNLKSWEIRLSHRLSLHHRLFANKNLVQSLDLTCSMSTAKVYDFMKFHVVTITPIILTHFRWFTDRRF